MAVDAREDLALEPFFRFTVRPAEQPMLFEDLLSLPNVMLFALDTRLPGLLLLVEVDDWVAVYDEPFLDRAIPRHAGRRVWTVRVDELEQWAASKTVKPTIWVWNSGRCGSTLLHRLLSDVQVASVKEPVWMDTLALTRNQSAPHLTQEYVDRLFNVAYAVEAHIVGRVFPAAKMMSMNGKSFGFRIIDSVMRNYPDHKHLYLYRSPDEVAQSFTRSVLPSAGPLIRLLGTSELLAPLALAIKPSSSRAMALMSAKMQQLDAEGLPIVSHAFSKHFVEPVLDGFAYWLEHVHGRANALSLRYKELTAKDVALRRRVVHGLLSWVFDRTPIDEEMDAAMVTFSKDSQANSAMSKSNATRWEATYRLSPRVMEQLREAGKLVSVVGEADFVIPGSLLVS